MVTQQFPICGINKLPYSIKFFTGLNVWPCVDIQKKKRWMDELKDKINPKEPACHIQPFLNIVFSFKIIFV